ncbi:MAG TPA: TlpA disulfide reductase family protein [Nocardioides sp.]|nr:TlpA disulfide reductase family protein [Nocardioides sp.]
MALVRRGLVGVAACLLALTGCSSLGGTDDLQFIDDEGSIRIIAPEDRGDPIDFEGRTLTGDSVSSDDYRGKVLVVNKWWSGCGPCRSEMPLLAEAADELAPEAAFLGVNIRDPSADQGLAFMRSAGADYPSIWDVKGTTILAFSREVPMVALPATVVLDAEGRAAAVISGEIPSKQTLLDVVDEVAGGVAEEPADG